MEVIFGKGGQGQGGDALRPQLDGEDGRPATAGGGPALPTQRAGAGGQGQGGKAITDKD